MEHNCMVCGEVTNNETMICDLCTNRIVQEKNDKEDSINYNYDSKNDILYINDAQHIDTSNIVIADEDIQGVIVRKSTITDSVIGITILDFKTRFSHLFQ